MGRGCVASRLVGGSVGVTVEVSRRDSGWSALDVAAGVDGSEKFSALEPLLDDVDCDFISDRKATFADNSEYEEWKRAGRGW